MTKDGLPEASGAKSGTITETVGRSAVAMGGLGRSTLNRETTRARIIAPHAAKSAKKRRDPLDEPYRPSRKHFVIND